MKKLVILVALMIGLAPMVLFAQSEKAKGKGLEKKAAVISAKIQKLEEIANKLEEKGESEAAEKIRQNIVKIKAKMEEKGIKGKADKGDTEKGMSSNSSPAN